MADVAVKGGERAIQQAERLHSLFNGPLTP